MVQLKVVVDIAKDGKVYKWRFERVVFPGFICQFIIQYDAEREYLLASRAHLSVIVSGRKVFPDS